MLKQFSSLIADTWNQARFDVALDLTRLGQRLMMQPLTPRSTPFYTADLVKPKVSGYANVDPTCTIVGKVKIRDRATLGAGCVVRGETGKVFIQNSATVGSRFWLSGR